MFLFLGINEISFTLSCFVLSLFVVQFLRISCSLLSGAQQVYHFLIALSIPFFKIFRIFLNIFWGCRETIFKHTKCAFLKTNYANLEEAVFIIAVRTFLIYSILTFFMRFLGKRQVGQLEIGEFVSTLLLSELAAFPIADPNIPLTFAILPVTLIVLFEFLTSCLCARFPFFKKMFDGCPAVLIRKGKLDEKALFKARFSPDELLSQLRLKNVANPTDVDYAILEQNGQLSVILKKPLQNLTPQDVGMAPANEGYATPIVICGRINYSALDAAQMTKKVLLKKLKGTPLKDVLLFTIDDGGNEYLVKHTDSDKTKG